MKIAELREKSTDELKQELFKLMQEQFNLRMQKGTNQLKRNHFFGVVRRSIARIYTLLQEREANKA